MWEWVCRLFWYREEALAQCHFLRLGDLTEEQICCTPESSGAEGGGVEETQWRGIRSLVPGTGAPQVAGVGEVLGETAVPVPAGSNRRPRIEGGARRERGTLGIV